jgi:hypothetical protein
VKFEQTVVLVVEEVFKSGRLAEISPTPVGRMSAVGNTGHVIPGEARRIRGLGPLHPDPQVVLLVPEFTGRGNIYVSFSDVD